MAHQPKTREMTPPVRGASPLRVSACPLDRPSWPLGDCWLGVWLAPRWRLLEGITVGASDEGAAETSC